MKQYIKPSVNVVELAVRENIAALPSALVGVSEVTATTGQTVTITTYNLAAQQTSDKA